jgi:hypothetical protein
MKCNFIKSDGKKCKANALSGSSYCWYHSPEIPEVERKLVSSNGGKANGYEVYVDLKPIIISRMQDIPVLLIDTIHNLRSGNMGIRLGTAIGYLSGMLLKSFEVAELEIRMEKIEKYIVENLDRDYHKHSYKTESLDFIDS